MDQPFQRRILQLLRIARAQLDCRCNDPFAEHVTSGDFVSYATTVRGLKLSPRPIERYSEQFESALVETGLKFAELHSDMIHPVVERL